MKQVNVIRVTIKDNMNEITLENPTMKNLTQKLLELSEIPGQGKLKELYNWTYNDTTIKCYGWYNGDAGLENKHELVPYGTKQLKTIDDSETQLLFGDLFLVRKGNRLIDFTVDECAMFYESILGEEDTCNSDDETDSYDSYDSDDLDDLEDETGLDDFIVNDGGDNQDSSDEYYPSDYELDEDTHNY